MEEEKKLMITTIVTIALAFLGYIVKYLNDIALVERKDKLDRINKQLGEFYGPLYSLLQSNHQAWLAFREKNQISGAVFDRKKTLVEEDLVNWRHYIKFVFMPANNKIYEVIVSKSDLLVEDKMPESLLKLITHIIIYRAVVNNWELGNFTEHTSIIDFPNDASEYICTTFDKLKKEQYRLLNGE